MINEDKSRDQIVLPKPGIEPQSPSSHSVALTIWPQQTLFLTELLDVSKFSVEDIE